MSPIELIAVSKQYGTTTALQNLTLAVHPGECLVLLGPNGAGKTTTIRLMMGLISPTSGTIKVYGDSPKSISVLKRIGYLPGEMGWPLQMQGGEWLEFLAQLSTKPDPAYRRELLTKLEFPLPRLRSYLGTLSQGMKRKLGLVAALEHRPDCIILDEPSDGLDPVQQKTLIDLLRMRHSNSTLLLSTHDLREAFALADRIAIFANGEMRDLFPKSAVDSIEQLEARFFQVVNR